MDQIFLIVGATIVWTGAFAVCVFVGLVLFILASVAWRCIIWRRPHNILRISTIDREVTTQGREVKRAADLEVSAAYGFGWKRRFLFGLLVFEKDARS